MKGRILKGIGGFYYVEIETGEIIECRARGKFRKDKECPKIGDIIEVNNFIEVIYERKNSLNRPPISNIDSLLLICSPKNPEPDFLLIDKILIACEINNINAVICVNKSDLENFGLLEDTYKKAGYKVIKTSVKNQTGFCDLEDELKGKITVFAGISGVGKSSILKYITKNDKLEIGEISQKTSHGRHTTRHVELLKLDTGGYVADTPGFSSFDIDVDYKNLYCYFREMKNYTNCKFSYCSHITEPGCEVKMNIENIPKTRYDNYVFLYNQLKQSTNNR